MWMFVILLISSPVLACDKGCSEYEGNCACEATPEKAAQTIQPSDEKPRQNKLPQWQTGEVNADITARPSTTSAAENYKAEKAQQ